MGNDKSLLLRAIEIAGNSLEKGGGPFGAVMSRDGKIISEAHNCVVLNNDPTAHAEILAIRQAASFLKSFDLSDCTLYSSCEPCPMCLGAIYWAGIKKVVYACDRSDAQKAGFNDKLIYDEIALDPSKRKITFLRITDTGGKEVFRRWDALGNKIGY
ncbi:MAG: nucleoside deaminase [Bacteroidetes bacterium]|nr:MAG: nucleoside deaminase [Bacteroidota bacterium]